MAIKFDLVHPSMAPWGTAQTLFTHPRMPLLFKKVANMADALKCGGVILWNKNDPADYEWYIGETAVKLMSAGMFGLSMKSKIGYKRGDGDYERSSPVVTSDFTQSGTAYTRMSIVKDRWATADLQGMAVVSNATYGFGNNSSLEFAGQTTDAFPGMQWRGGVGRYIDWMGRASEANAQYADATMVPGPKLHRGSIIVPIAFHKKLFQIIREQKPAIIEGAGDGTKYVEQALSWFFATKKDQVIYMPLVVTYAGDAADMNLTVGHWVRDRVSTAVRPNVVFTDPVFTDSHTLQLPVHTTYASGVKPAVRADANAPVGGTFTDRSWMLVRSFEGAAVEFADTLVPCPYYASEATMRVYNNAGANYGYTDFLCKGDIKVGKGQKMSSYVGIDTSYALEGALPALVRTPAGGRANTGFAGTLANETLFGEKTYPQMPTRVVPEPTVTPTSTPSQINEAYLAKRANADLVGATPRVLDSWSTYWSPVSIIEQAVTEIYDKAIALAQADN